MRIEKSGTGPRAGEDLSGLGAFARGETVILRARCPRELGAAAVVLRMRPDGGEESDTPLSYTGTDAETMTDTYELELDTAALCGSRASGLFWWKLLIVRGADTLFTDSTNNVDFRLKRWDGEPFRMTVYERDFETPAWFGAGVMYHVFVDRFRRGQGEVSYPTGPRGSTVTDEWETGIPQYPDVPGGKLKNDLFFGGNLWGVAEKLDYLASLGVTVIYLSPIFRAYSNHKYDTGDYMTVDPGFGGEAALDALIRKARKRGMRVILDGVFNHTGDDSRYFNRYGTYPETGAYQSPDSPYADWYSFDEWPDEYASWWGIPILPKLNHASEACRRFFTGPDGVCAHYVRRGIGGWRLDVADELNDAFLDELRETVKAASPGETPVVIGEVWENAADKIAYGHRRRYLQGRQLDSVMNYPVRTAILSFVRDGDAQGLVNTLTELYASYPRPVSDCLMNLLGTHDTERVLTVLGSDPADFDRPNAVLASARLSPADRTRAARLLKLASVLQFTVFGIPSVYYGDEAGLEGFHDPFCRMPFPWHDLDDPLRAELLAHYRSLGAIRRLPPFDRGSFRILAHGPRWLCYERVKGSDRVLIAVNAGPEEVRVPLGPHTVLLSVGSVRQEKTALFLGERSAVIVK